MVREPDGRSRRRSGVASGHRARRIGRGRRFGDGQGRFGERFGVRSRRRRVGACSGGGRSCHVDGDRRRNTPVAVGHGPRPRHRVGAVLGNAHAQRSADGHRGVRAGVTNVDVEVSPRPRVDSCTRTFTERSPAVGLMPYHLEKGHFLLLLEDTLNEGIEAVVDNDAVVTFPGLTRRYSMLDYMRAVLARPCDLIDGEQEEGSSLWWPGWMTDEDVAFAASKAVAQE